MPDDVHVPLVVLNVEPVVHGPETIGAAVLMAVSVGTTIVEGDEDVNTYVVPEIVLVPNTCERIKYPTSSTAIA